MDYSIELCSNHTGSCSRWNTGSNDTFYDLEGEDNISGFLLNIVSGSCVKLSYNKITMPFSHNYCPHGTSPHQA